MNTDKFGISNATNSYQNSSPKGKKKRKGLVYFFIIVIVLILLGGCLIFSSSTFVVPNFLDTIAFDSKTVGITGTPDSVIVRPDSAGNITILTPQPIATSSTPTFSGLTLVGYNGNVRAEDGKLVVGGIDLSNEGDVSNVLSIENGGTGIGILPAEGQLLVGGNGKYNLKNLIAGDNVTITQTDSTIIISATGGGSGATTTILPGNGIEGDDALGPGLVTLNVGEGSGIVVDGDVVSVNLDNNGTATGITSSISGLEASTSGLRLIGGCSNDQILKWSGGMWTCSSDSGGSGSGITDLNGLNGSSQTFATGTSGLDFNISSAGTVHTFNMPTASTTVRGLVSTTDQTFGGNKTFNNNLLVSGNTTIGNASSDTVAINALVNSNVTPATDNTFDLGSLSNRWKDLYLGPSSLNIVSTGGTGGAGTNYVLGTLGYDGTALQLATNNVGSSSGGALNFISALPSTNTTTSAFYFNTTADLNGNDELFQISGNGSDYLSLLGNGRLALTPRAINASESGDLFTIAGVNNSTLASGDNSFLKIIGTQDLSQVGNPFLRTNGLMVDLSTGASSNGGYMNGVLANLTISSSELSRGGAGFSSTVTLTEGTPISSNINGYSANITNNGTISTPAAAYSTMRGYGTTLTNNATGYVESIQVMDGTMNNYGEAERILPLFFTLWNYGNVNEDYMGLHIQQDNNGHVADEYNGIFLNNFTGGGGSVSGDYSGIKSLLYVDSSVGGNSLGNYISITGMPNGNVVGDVIGLNIDFGGNAISNDSYGIFIDTVNLGASSNYGMFISGATGGSTSNYALYVDSGLSRFAQATTDSASINIASSDGFNPSTPLSGDLWWNGSSLNFYNGSSTIDLLAGGSGGGSTTLSGLTDVDLSGLANGDVLMYDGFSSLWIPAAVGGTGTVTEIIAGNGLIPGTITTSGTIEIDAPTCDDLGEALSWTGTSFTCVNIGGGGGSGATYSSWDPFAPPSDSNGYGYSVLAETDEFSTGTLDADWNTYDHSSVMNSASTIQGKLVIEIDTDSAPWAGIYKSLPASSEWTIETHVQMQSEAFAYRSVGLGLFEDAASDTDWNVIRLTREQDGAIRADRYINHANWLIDNGFVSKNWSAEDAFFRWTYDGTFYRAYWSLDGSIWTLVAEEENIYMSPTEFGLVAKYDADGDLPLWAIFDFVRVYDTALASNVPAQGQMVDKGSGSGGGSTTFAGLSDVDLTGLTDGNILMYNAGLSKWEAVAGGGGGGNSVLFAPSSVQTDNSGRALISLEYTGEPSGNFTGEALLYINNTEYDNDLYSAPDFLRFDSSDYGGTVFSVGDYGDVFTVGDIETDGDVNAYGFVNDSIALYEYQQFLEGITWMDPEAPYYENVLWLNANDNKLSYSDDMRIYGTLSVDILNTGGSEDICLDDSNVISDCSSSKRYKHDIQDLGMGLETVLNLRPVKFNWNSNGVADLGFVAEEVNSINPLLVTFNDEGQVEGVKYKQLTAVLVNAVKKINARLELAEANIAALDDKISSLETMESGSVIAPTSVAEYKVDIENFDVNSRVILTPRSALGGITYYVENEEAGFIIKLSSPLVSEVKFDYVVISGP